MNYLIIGLFGRAGQYLILPGKEDRQITSLNINIQSPRYQLPYKIANTYYEMIFLANLAKYKESIS